MQELYSDYELRDDFALHPVEGFTIDIATMDSEADDSSGILAHDDHDRKCLEQN